jgi:hypothetical protein
MPCLLQAPGLGREGVTQPNKNTKMKTIPLWALIACATPFAAQSEGALEPVDQTALNAMI